jgi:HPt (histidine-containing phosphotransfer) domain-containing protein
MQDYDSEKLARITHQIKPSLTLLGLDSLRETAVTLEGNFNTTKLPNEQLSKLLTSFIKSCSTAIKSLKEELTTL